MRPEVTSERHARAHGLGCTRVGPGSTPLSSLTGAMIALAPLSLAVCSIALRPPCTQRQLTRPHMSLDVRAMREVDIPSAARLLSTSFAPSGGYNWLQSRISREETSTGLQERLGQTVLLVAAEDDGTV
eukprot:6170249-Prymnesium_polylepis.1